MELGDSKRFRSGGVPVAHLTKSMQSDWGESQAWDWNTTQDLLPADQKGGLPGKVHRSILVRHILFGSGGFSIHSCPSEGCQPCTALNQVSPRYIGLVVKMLTWLLEGGTMHTQEGKVALRGSPEPILTHSTPAMTFQGKGQCSTSLRVQPSREDTPNETAAFLFLPQISFGLAGKERVRSNSAIVSFHQKQQR